MASIAVIGCGWFGLPLAQSLVKQGHQVFGSKRSEQDAVSLNELGIRGFALDLAKELVQSSLSAQMQQALQSDILVVNIPPGLRRGETNYLEYVAKLEHLLAGKPYKRLVFISTTGVYPTSSVSTKADDATVNANALLGPLLDETMAQASSPASNILLKAESVMASLNMETLNQGNVSKTTIVRFAGLIGLKRHPGRFFAGKTDVPGGNVAVNLVHLDDCVAAVSLIIHAALNHPDLLGEVYNLCAPIHLPKSEFYSAACEHLGVDSATFSEQPQPSKRIDGSLICRDLGFRYLYQDPRQMLDAC
ncbi:SDR family NAD(P)-dependent oxidoreductase [Shewanella sp. WXL01]|uniref:NAD(P)-binding domain-containing protein n=1 Tax=Shewanella sp. WXL01 TaxID=2709721 RepID=UPI0014383752|nr:NAD(P)-binding domain-containing protein [Shewanella sp. WXL01]NKF50377.1 SDR family NAD(P)-dependent oxidoreductase [Shewanella sp. WXL01]